MKLFFYKIAVPLLYCVILPVNAAHGPCLAGLRKCSPCKCRERRQQPQKRVVIHAEKEHVVELFVDPETTVGQLKQQIVSKKHRSRFGLTEADEDDIKSVHLFLVTSPREEDGPSQANDNIEEPEVEEVRNRFAGASLGRLSSESLSSERRSRETEGPTQCSSPDTPLSDDHLVWQMVGEENADLSLLLQVDHGHRVIKNFLAPNPNWESFLEFLFVESPPANLKYGFAWEIHVGMWRPEFVFLQSHAEAGRRGGGLVAVCC